MSDLDRATQLEFIMDHYQNPRNRGEMADADVHVEGGHPGCSDLITMYLKFDGDRVSNVSYIGEGCTISQASVSALTEQLKGMTIQELEGLDHEFISDLIGEEIVQTRPRCATLGLDVLHASIKAYRKKQILGG
ncbi:MAG TPA: iron-sulfur cluster assembly scaffold protein [Anaerolineaceae bacterium]|nr:iron-sulfur cluster assembly scaffold protein [Anaerolineaceae bacterium]